MSKRATPIKKPKIILDQNAPAPLYRQLYERLRAEILAGQLERGTRLPSTRALASELGISRNTTALAYEQLLLEGYIESRVGDGTRVAHLQTERLRQITSGTKDQRQGEDAAAPETPLSQRGLALLNAPFPGDLHTPLAEAGPFRVGQPDVEHFPYEIWARLVARHARHSLQASSLYQDVRGYYPLREAIAAHIGITRGVYCSPEQIIITSGSQGALDLVARTLLDPGDQAWVEHPGYEGAWGALLAAGAELVPVPVDREGIEVETGQKLCPQARAALVTPSHQFPTGVTMSLNRRLALLEWAREARAWIVEDDYDSEYRFSGRPLEALQGLDSARRVLYIGTFSKVLFPALRLGYLVAPLELLPGLTAARHFIDVHPPILEQMALVDFMSEGHFTRHLRHMRQRYLERRDALIDALKHELKDMLEVTTPQAGIHLAAWLPPVVSKQEVARLVVTHRLPVQIISSAGNSPRAGLLLGYSCASPAELRAGVSTLARALKPLCPTSQKKS